MQRAQPAILMVDDDLDQCRNMCDILSDQGYSVDMAHEGQAALRLVRQRSYDVALLDLRLPGMDGLALCREAMQLHPAMAALMITGYPGDIKPADAQAAGIRRILPKPVNVAGLLLSIEEVLAS